MCDRIHILGASGSGTTTLGKALSAALGFPHFDSDDYFWLSTNPPFRQARPTADRRATLESALSVEARWILSGSCCGWGDFVIPRLNFVVFLLVPCDVRLERLRARELKRYGQSAVSPGGAMCSQHADFLEWASKYDEGGTDMRSRALHEEWLGSLDCEVLRVEGVVPTQSQVTMVLDRLSQRGPGTFGTGFPDKARDSS